jgi:diguanylate cyclase (GGDEF)-like protein
MRRVFLPLAATTLAGLLASLPLAAAESVQPVGPRQLTFAHFGTEDGLDSLTVFDLALDRAGNLWVGTQEGLSRFDGERFRNFGVFDGLPSGVVFDVEQDAAGDLWAATLKGLARLAGRRFEPIDLPGSPAGESVEALALDAEGRLLAGGVGGAYRCAGRTCERILEVPADMFVSAIALDRTTGELWFGGPFGLVRWRGRELERFTRERGLPSHATRALLVDRYGSLWVRQIRALVRVDTNDGQIEVVAELPPAADTSRLYEDSRGTLWVTSDAGLFRHAAGGWDRIGTAEGLPEGAVSAVVEDAEGALWIGLAHAGLARWLGRDRFVSWTAETGLPGDVVWAIERGADGRLAFGTQSGLAVLDATGRRLTTFPGDPILGDGPVLSVTAAAGGFWVGSAAGGLAFVDAAGRVVDAGARSGFTDDLPITRIVHATDGDVWLATGAGLWRGRGTAERIRFERVEVPGASPTGASEAGPPEIFFDLLEDRDGALWAAGRYGLARRRHGVWTRLTTADGLRDDFLLSIAEDRSGALWIGYRDARGVSLLGRSEGAPRFQHFDTTRGLRHDQVTFVRTDALGRVWVGTTRGVSIRAGDRFVNFRRSDGLVSEDSCSNAFFADRDGTTWIGTPSGAVAARIAETDLAPRPPLEARIVSAALGGMPFGPASAPSAGHGEATFEVAFAARTFRAPREVEFRYRLQGADAEPIVTRQRSVRYPALPDGVHEFRVEARLEGTGWGPPATLRFEVLPPWWAGIPARLGALALAVLAGLAIDRLRARRDRRRAAELEHAVAERTDELQASREELARKNEELAHLSLTDPLTGLKNRRFAWEFLAAEVERVGREQGTAGGRADARLVFFLMDVDLFKSINDLHGHEVGDRILIEAAERVRDATRISDVAVRWGGEEFLVIARDLPAPEWPEFAARLRRTLADPPFVPSPEIGPVRCTGSLGYAAYPFDAAAELPWQQVLRLADLALYAVKQCGRDADLGVTPGRKWTGVIPADLLAGQAGGLVDLRWGNVARPQR